MDDSEELLPWEIEEREEERKRQELEKQREAQGYYRKSRFAGMFNCD